jgi:hypothetical protein
MNIVRINEYINELKILYNLKNMSLIFMEKYGLIEK